MPYTCCDNVYPSFFMAALCTNLFRSGAASLCCFILLLILGFSTAMASSPLHLSSAEKSWLKNHAKIRVQLAEDWPPYNYVEDGKPKGYVNEYLLLLADQLGIEVSFVSGYSWSEYVSMLETQEIDCITNMTVTPQRRKRFLFSQKSVVDVFNSILTRKNSTTPTDLEQLRGATVAVARGYAQEELLERYYPDITLLTTANLLDSIRRVMSGEADAAIGAHGVFNYYIGKHLLDEVSSIPITANVIFPSAPHHLAVHPDNTILLSLLDKAAASLSKEELSQLHTRWYMSQSKGTQPRLSEAERRYLAEKNHFNLCADPDWMPLEGIAQGNHIGMAADYMRLLAARLGVRMELVPTTSWQQTLEFAESRRCDLVSLAMSTPDRRFYLHFSKPYFTTPLVVATRESAPFIAEFGALRDRRVGVKKGYAFGTLLRQRYPQVEIVEVATVQQGLTMVRDGNLHGFVGSLPTLVYTLQKHYPGDMKIAGNTGEDLELRMGLRNDEPLLLSAMNKAIESITAEEHQEILNRWVSVQYEEGTNYRLIFGILAGGALLFFLLFYRQITLKRFNSKLRRRNQEIVEQSELLQKTQQQLLLTQYAVDSCSFPIFWLHHDAVRDKNKIVHANDAAAACLGYPREELCDIDPASIAESLMSSAEVAGLKGDKSENRQPVAVFHRRDGSTLPVELHVSSFTYQGANYRFIFFKDITRQREMEEKLHRSMKMEAVGLMAGGVAHDLNNILSGIVSYPELLLYQLDDDHPMRPQIEAIKNSGEQAAQIVDDLLTMARGVAAVRQTANLNTLIGRYLESPEFRRLQERHPRVSCTLNLDQQLANTHCSTLHVIKSIMNLVTNAYEATPPEGSLSIATFNRRHDSSADIGCDLASGDYVVFEVQDMGAGIAESAIAHIFEPFYSRKQMGRSGTGLGLSIVWNTAKDHSGGVTADNSSEGARFRLYLPATDEPVSQPEQKTVKEELHGDGEKILVIDDEPQQLEIACQMLTTLGYLPESAFSGEAALERVRRKKFDLVLLDMIMNPGMGGRSTYAAILEQEPGQKGIIVSGFSEDSEVRATLALGAGSFVRKPYSLYSLATAVKNVLNTA